MTIKNSKSAKAAKTTKPAGKAIPKKASPESTEGKLVRIHDLTGVAVFALPGELRQILNDEEYARCLASLEAIEVTLIVRETNDVIYVRMSSLALEPAQGSESMKELWMIPLGKTVAKNPSGRQPKARSGRKEQGHE